MCVRDKGKNTACREGPPRASFNSAEWLQEQIPGGLSLQITADSFHLAIRKDAEPPYPLGTWIMDGAGGY